MSPNGHRDGLQMRAGTHRFVPDYRPLREEVLVPQSPTSIRPALLDITGVAEHPGVTIRHVRRLVAEQRIPHIKWGGHLHFDPAEVDAWIDRWRRPERDAS